MDAAVDDSIAFNLNYTVERIDKNHNFLNKLLILTYLFFLIISFPARTRHQ